MSAVTDIEEGRQSGITDGLQQQNSFSFFRRGLQRTVTLFNRLSGQIAESSFVELSRTVGAEFSEHVGFAPKHLSVERISQLVGRDVGFLNLQLAASDDGSSTEVEWTRHNIALLISHCGTGLINPVKSEELSLIHESIVCNAINCAEDLFAYASREKVPVVLAWAEEDLLGWAVKRQKTSTVKFVLGKILGKCSTPMESARVIRKHFHELLKKFPGIMERTLEADDLCFEYGRFQVPAEIFEWRAPLNLFTLPNEYSATTNSTDAIPWKASNSKEVEEFWMNNDTTFAERMRKSSGEEVTAVSKFICIDCPFHSRPKTVMSHLISAKCSVDVFKSKTVKSLLQWRWQISARNKHAALLVIHLVLAILFFTFPASQLYERYDGVDKLSEEHQNVYRVYNRIDEHDAWYRVWNADTHLEISPLLGCLILSWFALFAVFDPLLVPYVANVTYICYNVIPLPRHRERPVAFFTSIHCLLILISILQALRPFKLAGPFVSMVYYTLWDIIPFLLLGGVMILSFGMAMYASVVGCGYEYDSDYGFDTVPHSFEYMFYAILDNSEEKSECLAYRFDLKTWRYTLLYVFLLLGPVVLLGHLIAALGDTFDRVMLTRDAEFVKSRANAVERRAFSLLHRSLSRLPFLRCCWRRPSQWFDEDMSPVGFFDYLLPGWKRSIGVRHRKRQLQKLQDFADSIQSSIPGQSGPVRDVLIFHFLVQAGSDTDSMRRPSWQGRIRALVRIVENVFDNTSRSLEKHSDETKQTLADVKNEIEAFRERTDETERKSAMQFDALQARIEGVESEMLARMERMENNHRVQFEALMGRINDIAVSL